MSQWLVSKYMIIDILRISDNYFAIFVGPLKSSKWGSRLLLMKLKMHFAGALFCRKKTWCIIVATAVFFQGEWNLIFTSLDVVLPATAILNTNQIKPYHMTSSSFQNVRDGIEPKSTFSLARVFIVWKNELIPLLVTILCLSNIGESFLSV